VAKLIYKPFSIVLGILAGAIAGRLFQGIWSKVDPERMPPGARTEDASTRRVVAARGVEAATAAMTVAAIDRAGARAFRHVTGFWPGESEPAPRAKS
jgi:Protein of unknown function (DUF4235)